ncbi:MAG: zinc ribbon domain-containing protein [Candidatus Gottesmanbacteria bacterium]|nr:zinc ribbon domain-containing protein [Candidatus Gottesmanbacteria bacterium]
MEPTCPQCHVIVRPTDYFCSNCGKSLHAKPLSTSLTTEIMYYAGSLVLPPLGYWWGIKYLKQTDAVSKRIGIVCIVLTTISFIVTSIWIVDYINKISATVNTQINGAQGF